MSDKINSGSWKRFSKSLKSVEAKYPELKNLDEDAAIEYGKGPTGSWTWELNTQKTGDEEYVDRRESLAAAIAKAVGVTDKEIPSSMLSDIKKFKDYNTTQPDVEVFSNSLLQRKDGSKVEGPFVVLKNESGDPLKGWFLVTFSGQRQFASINITPEVKQMIQSKEQGPDKQVVLREGLWDNIKAIGKGIGTALGTGTNKVLSGASKIPIFGGAAKAVQNVGDAVNQGVEAYQNTQAETAAAQQAEIDNAQLPGQYTLDGGGEKFITDITRIVIETAKQLALNFKESKENLSSKNRLLEAIKKDIAKPFTDHVRNNIIDKAPLESYEALVKALQYAATNRIKIEKLKKLGGIEKVMKMLQVAKQKHDSEAQQKEADLAVQQTAEQQKAEEDKQKAIKQAQFRFKGKTSAQAIDLILNDLKALIPQQPVVQENTEKQEKVSKKRYL